MSIIALKLIFIIGGFLVGLLIGYTYMPFNQFSKYDKFEI